MTTVDWYDKWTLGAMLLPAFEHYAQYGVPQHVGEFSVIGYANGRSPRSAFLWTRDSAELFDHVGANWHLWNGGFGLGNEFVREWFSPECADARARCRNADDGTASPRAWWNFQPYGKSEFAVRF